MNIEGIISLVIFLSTIFIVGVYVYFEVYKKRGDEGTGKQTTRLRVTNSSDKDLWIQQLNIPGEKDSIKVLKGESYDYKIPNTGVASVRVWPKTDCDSDGKNCSTGESIPPCPSEGCQPPFESKVEFTFGDLTSQNTTTSYDVSFADGYTRPLKVIVKNPKGENCKAIDASELTLDVCPENETLVNDKNIDLRVKNTLGDTIACISPCQKSVQPSPYGLGISINDEPSLHMCCPTNCKYLTCQQGNACNCVDTNCSGCVPNSNCTWENGCATSASCGNKSDKNSVVNTKYYSTIKKYAPYTYGYAYDDNPKNKPVLFTCDATTQYEIIFY